MVKTDTPRRGSETRTTRCSSDQGTASMRPEQTRLPEVGGGRFGTKRYDAVPFKSLHGYRVKAFWYRHGETPRRPRRAEGRTAPEMFRRHRRTNQRRTPYRKTAVLRPQGQAVTGWSARPAVTAAAQSTCRRRRRREHAAPTTQTSTIRATRGDQGRFQAAMSKLSASTWGCRFRGLLRGFASVSPPR